MREISDANPVAYFCAEFGLDAHLPTYAGGLGVLAGDTVKQASDEGYPMVALGLLYRGCVARQIVGEDGWQEEHDVEVDPLKHGFEHVYLPESDQPLFVKVHLTKKDVWARVWKKRVNQTTVYLLDTDTDQNDPEERGIACALYSGGEDFLLKQQMILGIGGIKVLDKLNITPAVYHVNEGRPAFLFWQLIRRMMDKNGLSYEEAAEHARDKIVYTNHTLVRAGNNAFDIQLLKAYALYYAEKMSVSINKLLEPGIDETNGAFSMTQFALNTSRKASAVSTIHYELSKEIWPEYDWVGITNGVHMNTWQDERIRKGDNLWQTHLDLKRELMEFVQEKTGIGYDPNRLVIGWARRIAAYKRPQALFEDLEELERIVKSADREVQIVMAGKAHIKDKAAKGQLQSILAAMGGPLSGHAVYVPNYNIEVAQHMVKGVDVWLNTPILGKEASGTSGMKAAANGVLQLTVEDGWSAEVDWHDLGWTLDSNHLRETIYFRLKDDIVPSYYHRDEQGVPRDWLTRMEHTIRLADHYNTARMLEEYKTKLYA